MRHLALVRAFLLVWVHLTLVTATHPPALHALALRWIDEGHRFPRAGTYPTTTQTRIIAEFIALAASILAAAGIIRTNDQVKATFKNLVKNLRKKISGTRQAMSAKNNAKNNAKLKEERRQRREKTLLDNPELAPKVLFEEQIEAWCEKWLDTPFPRRNSAGQELTWREAIISGEFAIYFGTTRRTLEEEWLGFLTTRGRNRPILERANGTPHFTPKEVELELGFFCVEVGVGDLLHHNCRAKEDYLQGHQTHATADIDENGDQHRRLGQQLHRYQGKGSRKQEPGVNIYRVFASVAPITKHNFVPLDNPNRRTIWLNNVECRAVY